MERTAERIYEDHQPKGCSSVTDGADLEKLNFLLDRGCQLAEAITNYDKVRFHEGINLETLADEMMKKRSFSGVPERLRHLINRDNIVRQLKQQGYVETAAGVFFYEKPRPTLPRSIYVVFD